MFWVFRFMFACMQLDYNTGDVVVNKFINYYEHPYYDLGKFPTTASCCSLRTHSFSPCTGMFVVIAITDNGVPPLTGYFSVRANVTRKNLYFRVRVKCFCFIKPPDT